jgi:hypothetical protein
MLVLITSINDTRFDMKFLSKVILYILILFRSFATSAPFSVTLISVTLAISALAALALAIEIISMTCTSSSTYSIATTILTLAVDTLAVGVFRVTYNVSRTTTAISITGAAWSTCTGIFRFRGFI